MTQVISKSALVAEIERIKKSISLDRFLSEYEKGCNQGKEDVCNDLLSFLDTLEMKDVDLEEGKEYLKIHKDIFTSAALSATIGKNGRLSSWPPSPCTLTSVALSAMTYVWTSSTKRSHL